MPTASQDGYRAFLSGQYRARRAMEAAFTSQPPVGIIAPSATSGLIALDLQDLGLSGGRVHDRFDLRSPHAALGAAWVVAGSSLGNAAMLARRHKAGLHGAERFLSDTAMRDYFRDLLAALSRPYEEPQIEDAIGGAISAFAIFERCLGESAMEMAA